MLVAYKLITRNQKKRKLIKIGDQLMFHFQNGGASAHLWEFSNLRMLVDHDIPVIGGEDLPTISIRMKCAFDGFRRF